MKIRFLYHCGILLLMGMMIPFCSQAQFSIRGKSPLPLPQGSRLEIFDQDSATRGLPLRMKNKRTEFEVEGNVEKPILGALVFPKKMAPLYFYLENSEILIEVNPQEVEKSRIVGSKTNSLYRYGIESCMEENGSARVDCLKQYVENNSSSIFAPFVLDHLLSKNLASKDLSNLYGKLSDEATLTFSYWSLGKRLGEIAASTEGSKIPDFAMPDTSGRMIRLSNALVGARFGVLMFGASWCESCMNFDKEVARIQKKLKPREVSFVSVSLDTNKKQWLGNVRKAQSRVIALNDLKGWDSAILRLLSVDRIPFIIIVDNEGVIIERDVRIWELEKTLNQLLNNRQ